MRSANCARLIAAAAAAWSLGAGAARADLLVVAPHPDDEIITAAGVILRALQRGEAVRVVYMTNGDIGGQSEGLVRQGESVAATSVLGMVEDDLIFLGYPDTRLMDLLLTYTDPDDAVQGPSGLSTTYGARGLGRMDYHRYAFGASARNNGHNVRLDLAHIIAAYRPSHIIVSSPYEHHLDHAAAHRFVVAALGDVLAADPDPGYDPTIHQSIVWSADPVAWPNAMSPTTYFAPVPPVAGTPLPWAARESLDVPVAMQSTNLAANPKHRAIAMFSTQLRQLEFLHRFLHQDEIFWSAQARPGNRPPVPAAGSNQRVDGGVLVTLDARGSFDPDGDALTYRWRQVAGPSVTLSSSGAAQPSFVTAPALPTDAQVIYSFELVVGDGRVTSLPDAVSVIVGDPPPVGVNVARGAAATASSQAGAQTAARAIDGYTDGYPFNPTHEWASVGQGAGAWLQLTWSTPQTVDRVVLYDRINASDRILAGVLAFSDGARIPVGPLVNSGAPVEVSFAARTITSVRLEITQVATTTYNIGLAELEVYHSTGVPPPPPPPPSNLARSATARASSANASTGQLASKAIDGVVDGYPRDYQREWATTGERAGAWIELAWSSPQTVSRVVLHDRPNVNDRVTAGRLQFSDGSTISVGALSNDGAPLTVSFPPRRTSVLRFTVTGVSETTVNIGLAEIEVY